MAEALPRLIVASRLRAGEILTSDECGALTHLVSIGDPDWHRPDGFERVAKRLRLELEDIENPDHGVAATESHIEALLTFGRTVTLESYLLVHCEAGISRSTASAIIILTQMLGAGSEERCRDHVYELVDIAHPNRRMLRLADGLMDRDGALIAIAEPDW